MTVNLIDHSNILNQSTYKKWRENPVELDQKQSDTGIRWAKRNNSEAWRGCLSAWNKPGSSNLQSTLKCDHQSWACAEGSYTPRCCGPTPDCHQSLHRSSAAGDNDRRVFCIQVTLRNSLSLSWCVSPQHLSRWQHGCLGSSSFHGNWANHQGKKQNELQETRTIIKMKVIIIREFIQDLCLVSFVAMWKNLLTLR